MGRLTGGDGEWPRGCRAVAGVLLGHLQQAARRGRHWIARNARWLGRWSAERRGRRARPRARERGRCCLGGRGRWCESFQERRAAFYRREREHGVRGSAARARPVSAKEGTRQSVLSAEGCCGLWRAAGAFVGGGLVWCRGGKGGVLWWFSSDFHVSRPGPGRGEGAPTAGHSRRGRDTMGRTKRGLATGPCTNLHLCRFLPTMCSTKCPQEIKI
jgi:hypothetical protein